MSRLQMRVLVGLPGSGKSTWAKRHAAEAVPGLERVEVVSADAFFEKEGEYRFDPRLLSEAHGSCLRGCILACVNNINTVIVDNTNTTLLEISPYAAIAAAYGYALVLDHFPCSASVAEQRNIHGVPRGTLICMEESLEGLFRNIPPYWQAKIKEHKE